MMKRLFRGNMPNWQKVRNNMERLTIDEIIEHCDRKTGMYEKTCDVKYLETAVMSNGIKEYWEHKQVAEYLRKLKDYEDLEEQGRLIKLPCKVGDTVWDNGFGRPCAYTITAFSFGECEGYIWEPVTTKEVVFYYENSSGSITGSFAEREIGKSVFLNKSEAEAKLKEMEEK